jgi:hypothetical protein
MEKPTPPIRSEFRQLPWMVAKTIGGIAAALGTLMLAWAMTRDTHAALADHLPAVILTIAGFLVFIVAGGALAKPSGRDNATVQPAERRRGSLLSWSLFLLLAAGFLIFVHFMTR